MIDRLTLSRAIEDAGIERTKAERLASTIVDLIHDEVATKADVAAVSAELKATEATLRADIVALSNELKADIGVITGDLRRTEVALLGDISKVQAALRLVAHRLLWIGGLLIVALGLLFAALHYWPPGLTP
jgi:hypothetical protein